MANIVYKTYLYSVLDFVLFWQFDIQVKKNGFNCLLCISFFSDMCFCYTFNLWKGREVNKLMLCKN